jgi:hypothetical protein
MKTFVMVHNDKPKHIVELSYWDIIKLLFGREIAVHDVFVIRNQISQELFDLGAPRAE